MPLARTTIGSASYGSGAGSKTVSGITVAAGDLLVAIGCANKYSSICDVSISDTNMGGISWTEITYAGKNSFPTVSIFYGKVVTGSTTGTVTVGGDGDSAFWLEVHKFTGYDSVTPVTGGAANWSDTTTITCTLAASPALGDIVINASFVYGYDGNTHPATPGDSFIEIADSYVQEWGNRFSFQSQDKTNTTSTACSKTFDAAFPGAWASAIVKAGASNNVPEMDNSYRVRRS